MKQLFLTGLLSVFMLTAEVYAQSKSVFLHKQETMDALGLSKEQQTEIIKLTRQSFADISKLNQDSTLSTYDRKSKIYSVYRKRDAEYSKVLSKEQLDKYQAMKEAAKKQ